jgi:hypothetical protein
MEQRPFFETLVVTPGEGQPAGALRAGTAPGGELDEEGIDKAGWPWPAPSAREAGGPANARCSASARRPGWATH